MKLHPLGRTDLHVSRLGLGLAALGRPGYINLGHGEDLERRYGVASMQEHAHAVLDAAWTEGVRYFDVARSYGRGEEFLGEWLRTRGIAPAEAVVGSKWGYIYTAGWQVEAEQHEVKDHSLPVLRRQLEESRAFLGPHLDVYQIHSATLESGVLERADVLEELARLRASGLHVGLTLSGPGQVITLRRALDVSVDGAPLFATVQATWNLLEPSAGPALAEARAAGLGVIVKEVLANGRLTSRNTEPSFAPKRRALDDVAALCGTTIDALCIAAALAQPWCDIVLSGAASVEHLRSNVAALSIRWDEAVEVSLRGLAERPDEYWNTRARLRWN